MSWHWLVWADGFVWSCDDCLCVYVSHVFGINSNISESVESNSRKEFKATTLCAMSPTHTLAAGSLEITWKIHTWKLWTHDLILPCWCCSRNMTETEISFQTAVQRCKGGIFTQTWRCCNMKVMIGGWGGGQHQHSDVRNTLPVPGTRELAGSNYGSDQLLENLGWQCTCETGCKEHVRTMDSFRKERRRKRLLLSYKKFYK